MKKASKHRTKASDADEQVVDLVLDKVSRYFKLLAEPLRLKIIRSICETEKSVNEIAEETGANQANVSRHLSMMYSAGVLARRKDANFVLYTVSDPTLVDICRTVCNRMVLEFSSESGTRNGAIALADEFERPKAA